MEKIKIADGDETEKRRDKINAIIDCLYEDEDAGGADCLITDESCLSDWDINAKDVEKIKRRFPLFQWDMKDMYLWRLVDVLSNESDIHSS